MAHEANTFSLRNANSGASLTTQNANTGTVALDGEITRPVRPISFVLRLARVLWPNKTASELAMRALVTQRQAEKWLAGQGMSADALANLIRSDAGLKILSELMGDAKPEWWADFIRATRLSELRRRQQQLATELKELETD